MHRDPTDPRPISERLRDRCYRCDGTRRIETRTSFPATKYAPAGVLIDSTPCPRCAAQPTLEPAGLLAGGVSWGVFRTQLERQREELGDLRREVRELRTTVQDLTTKLAVVADRHDREHAT